MATLVSRWLAGGAAAFVVAGTFAASLTANRGGGLEARLRAFVAAAAREAVPMLAAGPREPVLGPAHDGDAASFYRLAAARLGPPLRRGDPLANPAALANADEGWWPALEPIVAALRMGAAARTCSESSGWQTQPGVAQRLRTLLRSAWKHAAARGESGSVVELWLTEQSFQLDAVESFHLQASFVADWTQARFAALDAGSACALATGLARLDARWPRMVPARRWLAQFARNALDSSYVPSMRRRLAAWRSGFDPKRDALDALWRLHDGLPALATADVAWPARAAQWESFLAQVPDEHQTWFAAQWRDCELRLRRDLASLRLVRLALAFRFGEALPALADPFADAPLQVHVDGDVATFRSAAGPDVLELRAQRR